jgi:putative transposase
MLLDKFLLHDIISIIGRRLCNRMDLDNNNHSVFLLYYHLVLVTKYRRKVIDDNISNRLKEIFEKIQDNYNITLKEWNHDKDHIHILFKAHPNTELSKFINAYKSASSRLIKKEYPKIKEQLWKEYFWSRSYCLLTTGRVSMEVIKKYIEKQGKDV